MARTTSTNYSTPSFPKASADTDGFDAFDVQQLAAAVDGHDHSTGKGLSASIPAGSITNAKLAADTARANLLTNGGFEIWQRGSGPFMANGAYSADRWINQIAGTDTLSVSRDGTNQDAGSQYCAAVTFTLGTGAGATTLYEPVQYTDAGFRQLGGRPITFSVRVRTSVANAVRLAFYDGSGFTFSAYHTGDGTYQTLSMTGTLIAGGTGGYVQVRFAASCTAYLDNAMLVVGSQAADYVLLHPADDLARCLRYYEPFALGSLSGTTFQAISTTQAIGSLRFSTPKPVTPTITFSAASDFFLYSAAAASLTLTGFSSSGANLIAANASGTVASGLVGGNACVLAGNNANAKVVIESNP